MNEPFGGVKVYFSGPITRQPLREVSDFSLEIIQFLTAGGAEVLSEHVAARAALDGRRAPTDRTAIDIRRQDLKWVDKATHFIAIVNDPSHGVGMELERAILKPNLGLNPTPILCLVQEQLLDKLTYMIRGVSMDECPDYYLQSYSDPNDAKEIVTKFLVS
ncbi:MAG: hypothetical protein JWN01_1284 [Patescibacteria group bacterium]|jgi:hypothetical protein|nr:hypothetical protein [Patescibacteria group bacterium]